MRIDQRLSERVIHWLERLSDRNLLIQFKNRLTEIPSSKRLDLKRKGYIARVNFHGSYYLTEEGEKLLDSEIEPPFIEL